MKKLALVGSSGSIGRQVLDVVRRYPDRYQIVTLSVNRSTDALLQQIEEFHPAFVAVADEGCRLPTVPAVRVGYGAQAVAEAAAYSGVDMSVIAVVGMCGLEPVLAAVRAEKTVALANKESLVAGGRLVTQTAREKNVSILPIDSEHSAVWQCLRFGGEVKRILLTASGGAYYGRKRAELVGITPEQAVRHPNWDMGKKISVDSATMMNKGLEIIEARWLFDTEKIDYIVHPQSIIHSMVEFTDGTVAAQLSNPSMDIPIQLALSYPDRLPSGTPPLDFSKNLTFFPPDEENFPLPAVCRAAMRKGGNLPCAVNAANEAAVQLFLSHKIRFTDIYDIVENALDADFIAAPSLADLHATFGDVFARAVRNNNGRTA